MSGTAGMGEHRPERPELPEWAFMTVFIMEECFGNIYTAYSQGSATISETACRRVIPGDIQP